MYFCINFVESESQVMKVNVIYDLTIPADAHAYRCSQKAVEAFYTLETLQDSIEVYMSTKTTSEACIIELYDTLLRWKKSNHV